ncbi:MAG: GlsB/YeaQ/YmgE family stress response membrane protein [Campylobacterales bacterium]|nr:GlsB/YeaQ/YmgE family stress response membrane protein [Campylobacterales bacterium]
MNLLVFLAIGAVAGWIAGQLMKGRSFGLVTNMIVGIIGSFIGGYLFSSFINNGGLIGSIATATLGAIVLLVLVKLLKKI